MQITCPNCKQDYDAEESLFGQTVECQTCGKVFSISSPSLQQTKRCPMCGESILSEAKKCRYCGEYLSKNGLSSRRKNRMVYCLLGLFLGGLGIHNFYAEQIPAGIVKVIIFIAALVVAVSGNVETDAGFIIFLGFISSYFVIWDLCYDPNTPTKDRKKIAGISPWLFSFLVLAVLALLRIIF